MKDNNYRFGVDWINGILPLSDVRAFFQFLQKLSPKLAPDMWVRQSQGKYNYANRYCLGADQTVQFMYNSPNNDFGVLEKMPGGCNYGIFITISGDGIRKLSSIHPHIIPRLFQFLYKNEFRCTRFDVYCDILDKNNVGVKSLREAFYYFVNPRCNKTTLKTNFNRKPENVKRLPEQDFNGERYMNFRLGNHGSQAGMFRCYNKLDETWRKHTHEEFAEIVQNYGVKDYWYRMEYELHGDKAEQIFNACLLTYNDKNLSFDFGGLWFETCKMLFTVVQCTKKCTTIKKLDITDDWNSFLSTISQIIDFVQFKGGKVFEPVPYVQRGLHHSKRVLMRSSAYIYFALMLFQEDKEFREHILSEGRQKYNTDIRYDLRREELFALNNDVSPAI